MFALRVRLIMGVIRPRADEAERASQRVDSLQTNCAEDVPSFTLDSELRREVEAAGNQPASLVGVSL